MTGGNKVFTVTKRKAPRAAAARRPRGGNERNCVHLAVFVLARPSQGDPDAGPGEPRIDVVT